MFVHADIGTQCYVDGWGRVGCLFCFESCDLLCQWSRMLDFCDGWSGRHVWFNCIRSFFPWRHRPSNWNKVTWPSSSRRLWQRPRKSWRDRRLWKGNNPFWSSEATIQQNLKLVEWKARCAAPICCVESAHAMLRCSSLLPSVSYEDCTL